MKKLLLLIAICLTSYSCDLYDNDIYEDSLESVEARAQVTSWEGYHFLLESQWDYDSKRRIPIYSDTWFYQVRGRRNKKRERLLQGLIIVDFTTSQSPPSIYTDGNRIQGQWNEYYDNGQRFYWKFVRRGGYDIEDITDFNRNIRDTTIRVNPGEIHKL